MKDLWQEHNRKAWGHNFDNKEKLKTFIATKRNCSDNIIGYVFLYILKFEFINDTFSTLDLIELNMIEKGKNAIILLFSMMMIKI